MNEDKNIKKNKEVFKVPEHYFDEFQAKMSELTSQNGQEKYSLSTGKTRTSLRWAYAVPAFMMVMALSYLLFFNTETETNSLADISTADLIDYLEEDGISEEELISYLDYEAEEIDLYPEGELLNDIKDSELENLSKEIDVFNEYL